MGGVDYKNAIPLSVTNGWTQTDGQTGANFNALDYRHGDIKITADSFTFIHNTTGRSQI